MHSEGTRQAPRNWRTPLRPTLQGHLPDVCHIPSSPSCPYLPLQKYHAQGEILCDNTHTHTMTGQHIHQGDMGRLSVTLKSLAGKLAAPQTRLGRTISQSAMQRLLVNYIKTVSHTHTHTHTHTHRHTHTHTAPMLYARLSNGRGRNQHSTAFRDEKHLLRPFFPCW